MTVNEVKMASGSWSLRLRADTPQTIINQIGYFGHIAINPGQINVPEYQDLILGSARYVGVLLGLSKTDSGVDISGKGMPWWLGDTQGTSDAIEIPVTFTTQTFTTVINTLLPSHGSITSGVINSQPGTYSGRHSYQSPREALDYVSQIFGTEWRVNGNGTFDAGTATQLFNMFPIAILQRKNTGNDTRYRSLVGDMSTERTAEAYTTRVLLLAEGQGDAIATGSATLGSVPYKDIHGNDVRLTRMVSESDTAATNAAARASLILGNYDQDTNSITLSSEDYDVKGDVNVGDAIWVYDPQTGLIDNNNEVYWEGDPVYPVKLRCIEMTWPVREGWTVAYRATNGAWTDLTQYVIFETGQTDIVVGDLTPSVGSISGPSEPIGDRPNADSSVPVAPAFTAISTGAYQSSEASTTKAAVYLAWSTPLNTDGSAVVDGDHYEIQYRVNAPIGYKIRWGQLTGYRWGQLSAYRWGAPLTNPVTTGQWNTAFVAWGTNSTNLLELTTGVIYELQIRAVDLYGHEGAWSASSFITTTGDNLPPSQPAAPVVSGNLVSVQVTHYLGKNSGGTFNLEADLDYLDVHVGGDSSFYAGDDNRVGRLLAGQAMLRGGIPAVGSFTIKATETVWVKVVAVDRAGNRSSASPAATVTSSLIDTAHISDLSVSKLTAGTMTAEMLLAGSIKTGTSGARAELDMTGLHLFNNLGQETVRLDAATANIRILKGRLEVVDDAGNAVVELGQTSDGRTGLRVNDRTGAPQVRIGELKNGGYGLEAVDSTGKVVPLSSLIFGIGTGFNTVTYEYKSTSYGDLVPAGPSVTVNISETGRAVVLMSALVQESAYESGRPQEGMAMSCQLTGANIVSPGVDPGGSYPVLNIGHNDPGIPGTGGGANSNNLQIQSSGAFLYSGLNPGPTTFSAKFQFLATTLPVTRGVIIGPVQLVVLPY